MGRIWVGLSLLCVAAVTTITWVERAPAPNSDTNALHFVRFELNRGQVAHEVDFLARTPRFTAFLAGARAVFAIPYAPVVKSRSRSLSYVAMQFLDANGSLQPLGDQRLPSYSNYLIGNDTTHWQRNVPHFARVRYPDLYPGIELIYRGGDGFAYDLLVRPGADPGRIRFRLEGANRLRLTNSGDLEVTLPHGRLVHRAPSVYQVSGESRSPVAGRFRLTDGNIVSFEVDSYDGTRALTIDPFVIAYSTYVGGSSSEVANAVAVDANNMAYVVGETWSTDFPVQGALQATAKPGARDAYVLKIDPNQQGSASLVYATYLGSAEPDAAMDVEVNAQGQVFVAGITHAGDFPVTAGGFKPTWTPNPNPADDESDAFIVVLNAQGNGLTYGTFFGGPNDDDISDLKIRGNDLYLLGGTYGAGFPTSASAFDATPSGQYMVFLSLLNWSANTVGYSTFYHANGPTYSRGLAVGTTGLAHVVGEVGTPGLPTKNAFLSTLPNGVSGSFYAVFDPSQSGNASLVYGTYVGAGKAEDVAVDGTGKGIVTGTTRSPTFPTTSGAFDTTCEDFVINTLVICLNDAFVMKWDPTLTGTSSLTFSTRLGGVRGEEGKAVAVDASANIYLTGGTASAGFPEVGSLTATARPDGESDAFVTILNPAGTALDFSTKLGGRALPGGALGAGDIGTAITIAPNGSAYVAGTTGATDFPIQNGFDNSLGGSDDAFFIKLLNAPPTVTWVWVLVSALVILLAFWKRIRNLVAGPVVPKPPAPGPPSR